MNANLSLDKALIDPSFTLRAAKWSDTDAVAQVIYDACAAEGDPILAVSADELRHGWQNTDFNLERDAFVVEALEGSIVGYADVTNSHGYEILNMNGNVHPKFKGRGIATTLLRAVEKRAREKMSLAAPDTRVVIETTLNINDHDSNDLHRNEGYQPTSYHWRMEIVLDGPPPEAKLPAGLELRPFVQGEHDAAVWQAQNEAFRDHPGSHDWTLEEWRRVRLGDPEFDPSLWAIAWEGADVAGFSLNRYRTGIG